MGAFAVYPAGLIGTFHPGLLMFAGTALVALASWSLIRPVRVLDVKVFNSGARGPRGLDCHAFPRSGK